MGVKDVAKKTMIEADVPTVPGSDGVVNHLMTLILLLKKSAIPSLLKQATEAAVKESVSHVLRRIDSKL
ncbi:hypothetical protein [Jeotgalicoccus sp. WY2]|uniref:hypothetical protein n=1 Tax=Jeotgalicoccus sp. WY2 TaxID=2708346 RepID=UPI0020207F9D|nr:hypothetical protein [Jeotgalicoccus sp. WY2]